MKVICWKCKNEYDWNSEDIFILNLDDSKEFICRNCLKIEKGFKDRKYHLQS